jgi:acyl phosphate:glycerol-3-phosphate acyltransferase
MLLWALREILFMPAARYYEMPTDLLQYWPVLLGYLLGSIPTAYIIARTRGYVDLRVEGDGKVSAAAVYRRFGRRPFLLVVVIDVLKGLIAVVAASLLSDHSWPVQLLTGFAAVAGHNWPVFLGFKGGLGATVMWGVLGGATLFQLLLAFIPTIIYIAITRKSGASTAIGIITLSIILIVQKILATQNIIPWDIPWYLFLFPIALIMLMVLKRIQTLGFRQAFSTRKE